MSLACAFVRFKNVFIVRASAVSPICKPETAPFNLATGALTCTTAKSATGTAPAGGPRTPWQFDPTRSGSIERSRKRTPEAPLPVKAGYPARANKAVPPDGYDVSWMRVSQCYERWPTWEGSTARLQR